MTAARRYHVGLWVCATIGTGTCVGELQSCFPSFKESQGCPGARAQRRDPRYRSPGPWARWEIPFWCLGGGDDDRLGTGACGWELLSCSPRLTGCRGWPGLEWRNAVAEVVRSEVSRSLATMLRGSTSRPAERRGRDRRSSRRYRRDNSSLSSTTDVSCSGDESAVAALLGAFRATPTPSTVTENTRGVDLRTQPTPESGGGEQGGGASRELPWCIDPGFSTPFSIATGPEAEGWPIQATPTPPTRVVPPKIAVNHPYYRMMFDCEIYALENKSVVYTRRQARALGRRKKDMAQYFGVRDEWDSPFRDKVCQFLRKFAKACDYNNISEGEAFYIPQDFTKEPLESEMMIVFPTRRRATPVRSLPTWSSSTGCSGVTSTRPQWLLSTRPSKSRSNGTTETSCPSSSVSAASTPSAGSFTGRARSRGAL